MIAEGQKYCKQCGRAITSVGSVSRGIGPCCEAQQGFVNSPFTIVIDSNESKPYRFHDIRENADRGNALILPQIERKAMWVNGLADYSISGLEERIQIERKSKSDFFATLGGRRDAFEQEIARLNGWCDVAYLVVEADWEEIITDPPERSKLNPKSIFGTHHAWTVDYPKVHWLMCGAIGKTTARRHAEVKTYRLLEMFWRRWIEAEAGNPPHKE